MTHSIENKVSRRYARALIERAMEQKALDAVIKNMLEMKSMLKNSEDLATFIKSPLPHRQERVAVMEALAKKAKFQDSSRKFLMLLAQHRRLNLLPQVLSVLDSMVKEVKGIHEIEIISPAPLNKTLLPTQWTHHF
jgi:F-type H+-transporting ATPase subunit delta